VISALPLSLALTVLFTGTGVNRCCAGHRRAGVAATGDQVAELSTWMTGMVGNGWGVRALRGTPCSCVLGGFSCSFLARLVLGGCGRGAQRQAVTADGARWYGWSPRCLANRPAWRVSRGRAAAAWLMGRACKLMGGPRARAGRWSRDSGVALAG